MTEAEMTTEDNAAKARLAEMERRIVPWIVDNPMVAAGIALFAGALAGSRIPGHGLIWRLARMVVVREAELALGAALTS
jgi:hypothetical protein